MNILSLQSHVAYGHVGNSAAVFALQRLGHEVWPVHTVQFSNHTGYGRWGGRIFEAAHIAEVVAGLAGLGVLGRCDAVLSGYLGDAAIGAVASDAVRRAKAANPAAIWCCDPVMGDVGKGLFVKEGVADFLRGEALAAADVLTPNHFELEQLVGRGLAGLGDVLAAARALPPRLVLVSSFGGGAANLLVTPDAAWMVTTPVLPFAQPPAGAGDALAALFLGHLLRALPPPEALSLAVSGLFAVLEATLEKSGELALVAAQEAMARPGRVFPAEPAC